MSSDTSTQDFLKKMSEISNIQSNSLIDSFENNIDDGTSSKNIVPRYTRRPLQGPSYSIYKKEADILKTQFGELNKDMQDIKKEINKDKSSLITILGIFVAFFTFVSMEIDVLKRVSDFIGIAGFSLLFVCLLVIFVFMIDFIARRWRNDQNKNNWPSYFRIGLIIVLIGGIGGILMISKSQSSFDNKINNIELTGANLQNSIELIRLDVEGLKDKYNGFSNDLQVLKKENDLNSEIRK